MLWRQGVLGIRRVHGEGATRIGTSLGMQERARGRVQVRKERGQLVAVLGCAGEALPPTVVVSSVTGEGLRGARQGEGVPRGGLEAVGAKGMGRLCCFYDSWWEGAHFTAQEVEDPVCRGRQPSVNGGKAVGPGCPICCLAASMSRS